MGASAEGALMMTFFAPPLRWAEAFSVVVKTPVDSTTISAPLSDHGMVDGSFLWGEGNQILQSAMVSVKVRVGCVGVGE